MTTDVFLTRCPDYGDPGLERSVARLLEACDFRPGTGTRVLVKPNLVAPANAALSCTNPLVVRAACVYLADCGAKILVGDSPAFGTAGIVARACGLDAALAGLPARLITLGRPRPLRLTRGGSIGLSADALDADTVLNIPRVKVHDQMVLTLAVKNFFGCVCGFRKAVAHQVHGERGNRFESMVMDVCQALPPGVSLLDGVSAMHVSGPARGRPFPLGVLGASANPVAMDTSLALLLGLAPEATPLGREAMRRGLPGALAEQVRYPLAQPGDFDATGFRLPECLSPVAFKPLRFVKGRLRSLGMRLGLVAPRE